MNVLDLLDKELKGKDWTLEEKARYFYIRSCELFSYDPRYNFCDAKSKDEIRSQEINLEDVRNNWVVCTSHAKVYGMILVNLLNIDAELWEEKEHGHIEFFLQKQYFQADATVKHDLERIKMKLTTYGYNSHMVGAEYLPVLARIDQKIGYIKNSYKNKDINDLQQQFLLNAVQQSNPILFHQDLFLEEKISTMKEIFDGYCFQELLDASHAIGYLQNKFFTLEEKTQRSVVCLFQKKNNGFLKEDWEFINIYKFHIRNDEKYYALESIDGQYQFHEISKQQADFYKNNLNENRKNLTLNLKR